jgi:hypothetical protein
MFKGELELEAELEDLMAILAESDLESEAEAEWTPAQARDLAEKQFIPYLISTGATDANQITDQVFYQLHPEWRGKKLPQDNSPAHEALRQEWRSIRVGVLRQLQKRPAASRPSSPQSVLPIDVNDRARFLKDLAQLETLVMSTPDPRNARYLCWFAKLKQPDIDDRVIRWGSICPTVGVFPSPIIGPCDITEGWVGPVQAQNLWKNIQAVGDVDTAGPALGIISSVKIDIVMSVEMTAQPLENLRAIHDGVQRAIEKLDKWANVALGGSSSMGREYVAMKDWIGARQRDPRSLYSCM